MKRILWMLVLVFVLSVFTTAFAYAAKPAEVWMGSYMLMRIRADYKGMSAKDRATLIQSRANNLTKCGGIDLKTIKVKKMGDNAAIFANKKLFATVTPADAKANGDTVMALAKRWADTLRKVYPKAIPTSPADCQAPTKKMKPANIPKNMPTKSIKVK